MTLMIIEALATTLFFVSTWYFLYRAVPKFGERGALCMLHNLRDDMYRLRAASDVRVDSLLFEDAIFSLTTTIHILRDTTKPVPIPVLLRMLDLEKSKNIPEGSDTDWRSKRYRYELENVFSDGSRRQALDQALTLFQRRKAAVMLYLVTSHPIHFLFALVASIVTVLIAPIWFFKSVYRSRPDIGSVGDAINRLKSHDEKPHHPSYA